MAFFMIDAASGPRPSFLSTWALVLQVWKLLSPPKLALVAVSLHRSAWSRLVLFCTHHWAAWTQDSHKNPLSVCNSFLKEASWVLGRSTAILKGITSFSHCNSTVALFSVWLANSYFNHSVLLSAVIGFTFTL